MLANSHVPGDALVDESAKNAKAQTESLFPGATPQFHYGSAASVFLCIMHWWLFYTVCDGRSFTLLDG